MGLQLTDWVCELADWLTDQMTNYLTQVDSYRLIDFFTGWLISWLTKLAGWLIWMVDWLAIADQLAG